MCRHGMVYLVGAGPGDPGLITVKGRRLLSSCDAVVYDHLASECFLDWVPKECQRIYVGKQSGRHSMEQEEINGILTELALSGLKVVRLKGGDPFVFGRGGEEILALKAAGIPYEAVPGVTSAVAVPECAGIPVTHRAVSRSFHVITGHTKDGEDSLPPEIEAYGALPGTLVFLMGLGQLPSIVSRLIAGGKSPDTPAAVIEKGTLPGQRTVKAPLSRIHEKAAEAGLGTPAIIVVGETASCEMRWARSGALAGIRVGITGTEHFAGSLMGALEAEGAQVSWVLDMKVVSRVSDPPMQQAYKNLTEYSWLVFTSANGVRLFFQGLSRTGMDHRSLGHMRFAVIGDGTGRELKGHGFQADYMPDTFCAEALAQGLTEILTGRDRLLIPRSGGGSPVLSDTLRDAGIPHDDIVLYEVSGCPVSPGADPQEDFDYLTFASASGVRAFLEQGLAARAAEGGSEGKPVCSGAKPAYSGAKLVCIGDITAAELEKHGMKADITAGQYHIEGLVQAIIKDVISSSGENKGEA